MPVYKYKCKKCKKEFEVSGSYSTLFSYKAQCPSCFSTSVTKIIGVISFILKGKGFYRNDNRET